MPRSIVFILVLIVFLIQAGRCWGFQATVIGVRDLNTIRVSRAGHVESFGLYGVCVPDKDQPFGPKAVQFLSSVLESRVVEVDPVETDVDGHVLGIVSVDGESINRQIIAFGLGWVDSGHCSRPECREWSVIQDRVEPAGKGFWSLVWPREAEKPRFVKIEMKCGKCGRIHKFYLQLEKDPRLIAPARKEGYAPLPEGNAINCNCGARVDLTELKREISSTTGKTVGFHPAMRGPIEAAKQSTLSEGKLNKGGDGQDRARSMTRTHERKSVRAQPGSLSECNRVGAEVTSPVLPHHSAYGSVHGGS